MLTDKPLKDASSSVLLVIPHYCHVDQLRPFLKDLLDQLPLRFSIRVSDDGSPEKERNALKELIADYQRNLVKSDKAQLLEPVFAARNEGKGNAVFRGWEASEEFSVVAFVDADGAIPASEIVRAEAFFAAQLPRIDGLFASRIKMLGRSVVRKTTRHIIGRAFATLVEIITKIDVYDSQCGLKIFRRETYEAILPLRKSAGYAFDVEILLLCKKLGFRIVEFPIDWMDRRGSKIKLLLDPIKMFLDVLRTKIRIDQL